MKTKIIIYLSLIFLLFIGISFSAAAKDINRASRINFKGVTGENFIGQAGLLYPFRNTENSLWFTDFRYRMSEDDVNEWNLGLGYRQKTGKDESRITGIYIFRDRKEEYDKYWDMWTIGGEILTDEWDFRVNGYITENEKLFIRNTGGLEINSNQILVYNTGDDIYYKSQNGLDIEIGKRFTEAETIFKNVGVYAKFYRFFEKDTPTMTGKQIRIDKKFGDRNKITCKIGAHWRDDNIRGSETEATFAVSIPFGRAKKVNKEAEMGSSQIVETRMTEEPERDLDVVVGKSVNEHNGKSKKIAVINPAQGMDKVKAWYVSQEGSSNSNGSKNNPYSINKFLDISQDITKKGDIIVLSGEDGDIYLDNKYISLKAYQQIISSYKNGHAMIEVKVDGQLIEEKFIPEVKTAQLTGTPPEVEGMIVFFSDEGFNTISGIKFNNTTKDRIAILGKANGLTKINNNYFIHNPNVVSNDEKVNSYMIDIFKTSIDAEIIIEQNEMYYKSDLRADIDSGAAINIENNGNEKTIKISENIIDGFYVSNSNSYGQYEYDSAIYISDFSNNLSAEKNNIKIENNTIRNCNYGITNLSSYGLHNGNFDGLYSPLELKYYNNNNFDNVYNKKREVIIELDS